MKDAHGPLSSWQTISSISYYLHASLWSCCPAVISLFVTDGPPTFCHAELILLSHYCLVSTLRSYSLFCHTSDSFGGYESCPYVQYMMCPHGQL